MTIFINYDLNLEFKNYLICKNKKLPTQTFAFRLQRRADLEIINLLIFNMLTYLYFATCEYVLLIITQHYVSNEVG